MTLLKILRLISFNWQSKSSRVIFFIVLWIANLRGLFMQCQELSELFTNHFPAKNCCCIDSRNLAELYFFIVLWIANLWGLSINCQNCLQIMYPPKIIVVCWCKPGAICEDSLTIYYFSIQFQWAWVFWISQVNNKFTIVGLPT